MSEEDLRKQIETLQRENQQLKAARKPTEYTVREEKFKGHTVLVFEGPSLIRPMTMGLGKLKAVHSCRASIDRFLAKHSRSTESEKSGACDDRI